ncbi:MAG: hypothetical protein QXM52_03130 [Candidatus Bathyarchaeia archaeon]
MKVSSIWENVDVNLDELISQIENFFHEKGLQTRKRCFEDKRTIFLSRKGKTENAFVEVVGDSRKFAVSFTLDEKAYSHEKLSSVFAPFFGGGFFLKALKSKEFFEKLERDFWLHLSQIVEKLNRA